MIECVKATKQTIYTITMQLEEMSLRRAMSGLSKARAAGNMTHEEQSAIQALYDLLKIGSETRHVG